ncbi:hypothetical protein [Williamsia sterculiae]|uniref:hypothetical protein n=1 Tax=Williamsia sterculiae TaxID=1344003 RepID=UPI00190E6D6A|nr:hypothetical protein [Williamsia sterculiae]
MKLTNGSRAGRRRSHVFGPLGTGLLTRHRMARMLPEEAERLVTAADLRSFNL